MVQLHAPGDLSVWKDSGYSSNRKLSGPHSRVEGYIEKSLAPTGNRTWFLGHSVHSLVSIPAELIIPVCTNKHRYI
jgi:hypothetical protein